VRICAITADYSVLFASEFGWMVRIDKPIDLLMLHFDILLLLLCCHDEASVRHQLILRF